MSMSTSVMTILKLKGTLHQMDTTMTKTLVTLVTNRYVEKDGKWYYCQ